MSSKNNIVFIIAESMDGRKMGCMGDPVMKEATPNLNKIADDGVLFTNAYSTCPVCNPSRASLWSGKYPNYYECWNNHEGLSEDIPTFRSKLEETGYQFKNWGKFDYLYGEHSIRDRVGSWTRAANIHRPLSRTPLPEIVPDNIQAHSKDENNIEQAIDWLQGERPESEPFMLCLSTSLVHPVFRVQEKYLNGIDQSAVEVPPYDPLDHPVRNYQQATKNALNNCPDELVLEIRKTYYGMIATLDEMVGRLLNTLDHLGLRDSTYVVFTSDHGEMAMEHGQILKRTMYEPSIHVPLIISGPNVQSGEVVDTPVSLIDIFPTLMDMAAIDIPEDLDGQSLMPQLKGETENRRDWAFGEYHGDRCNTGAFMVVKDGWKYIKYVGYEPLLFNLENDPWEIINLADERCGVVQELDELLATIVDSQKVDAQAKAYDKASFIKWRQQQLEEGTYEMEMAKIYSGFERLAIDDIQVWTSEDEKLILKWLDTD